jgi:hypothetical protein
MIESVSGMLDKTDQRHRGLPEAGRIDLRQAALIIVTSSSETADTEETNSNARPG